MRQLVYTMVIRNNRTSFHLWWQKNLVKHQKVSKCYEQDCRYQFSAWTDNFDFLDQICEKSFFLVQKSEHHHWILQIPISLVTKFHLKLASFIFWAKFALQRCFWYKIEKRNYAIEFQIFKLVEIPNFSLNW